MIAMSIISYPSALEPELHSAIVADASSLIIIAKLEAIDTLYQVYGTIGIPPAVFRETVQVGFERRKSDAFTIDVAIRSGHVVVVKLSSAHVAFAQHLYMANTLGWGECETLAFARDTNVQALIEERKGRSIARAEGIRYTTLQVFPLQGFIQHKISYDICVNLLDRIAVMMNTDLSILHALQSAAETIWHERKGRK